MADNESKNKLQNQQVDPDWSLIIKKECCVLIGTHKYRKTNENVLKSATPIYAQHYVGTFQTCAQTLGFNFRY